MTTLILLLFFSTRLVAAEDPFEIQQKKCLKDAEVIKAPEANDLLVAISFSFSTATGFSAETAVKWPQPITLRKGDSWSKAPNDILAPVKSLFVLGSKEAVKLTLKPEFSFESNECHYVSEMDPSPPEYTVLTNRADSGLREATLEEEKLFAIAFSKNKKKVKGVSFRLLAVLPQKADGDLNVWYVHLNPPTQKIVMAQLLLKKKSLKEVAFWQVPAQF